MKTGYTIHIDSTDSMYNQEDTINIESGLGIHNLLVEISSLWFHHPNIKITVFNHHTNDFIPSETLNKFLLGHANSLEVTASIIRYNIQYNQ